MRDAGRDAFHRMNDVSKDNPIAKKRSSLADPSCESDEHVQDSFGNV